MQDEIFKSYRGLLDAGLAKEIARFYLPVSTYTPIYMFNLILTISSSFLRSALRSQMLNTKFKCIRRGYEETRLNSSFLSV